MSQEQVVTVVRSAGLLGAWKVPAGLDQKTLVTARISAYATPSPFSEITLIKDQGVYLDATDYGALKKLRITVNYLVRSLLFGTCAIALIAVLLSDTPRNLNKNLFVIPSILVVLEIIVPSGIFTSLHTNFIVAVLGPWI